MNRASTNLTSGGNWFQPGTSGASSATVQAGLAAQNPVWAPPRTTPWSTGGATPVTPVGSTALNAGSFPGNVGQSSWDTQTNKYADGAAGFPTSLFSSANGSGTLGATPNATSGTASGAWPSTAASSASTSTLKPATELGNTSTFMSWPNSATTGTQFISTGQGINLNQNPLNAGTGGAFQSAFRTTGGASGATTAAPAPTEQRVPDWVNFEDLSPFMRQQLQQMEQLCLEMQRFADHGVSEENPRATTALRKQLADVNGQAMSLRTALALSSTLVAELKRAKDGAIHFMQYVCDLHEALHAALFDNGTRESGVYGSQQLAPGSAALPSSSSWSSSMPLTTARAWYVERDTAVAPSRTIHLPSSFMEAVTTALEQRAALCEEKLTQVTQLLAAMVGSSSQPGILHALGIDVSDAAAANSQPESGSGSGSLTTTTTTTNTNTIQRLHNTLRNEHLLLMQLAGAVAMLHERVQALREWFTLVYQQRRPRAPDPLQNPSTTMTTTQASGLGQWPFAPIQR